MLLGCSKRRLTQAPRPVAEASKPIRLIFSKVLTQ